MDWKTCNRNELDGNVITFSGISGGDPKIAAVLKSNM